PPLVQIGGWEASFLRPGKPAPAGTSEAIGWIQYKYGIQPRLQQWARAEGRYQAVQPERALRTEILLTAPNVSANHLLLWGVAAHNALAGTPPERPPTPEPSGSDELAARATPILALRAARRAIEKDPDHPEPYYILANVLSDPELPLTDS